ncbi:HLA class II histocompatibility antigen gamma chain [Seriola dumerili]|uniref:CD74 molecule, major histocompatibility complex, class II invariant chain a n=1 Tax=Seriola dumerili TaxID=41447 RepID=A0A3B4TG83_SERDU|nr:HLA class II histocompatibility antigen gamma chain [Seriola dumerili]
MAHNPEDAPLARGSLADSEEILIAPAGPGGSSNSRALKVAGLTTLACLLLASQVFTAYMVFNQKQQIHTLQKNSERIGKQLTRSSKAVAPARMSMPMNSLPLLMDYTVDEDSKTPLTKLQDTAIVSVEQQLKDLLLDSQLPQFNETFQVNMQSLKQRMNDSEEWKSLESWMRNWLIFQMAQQKPAAPTSEPVTVIKTKCQTEAAAGPGKIGSYKPQCDKQGNYLPMQCWYPTGFCWCVDQSGTVIEGTTMRGRPDCQGGRAPRRMMIAPRLMQKTIAVDEN